MGTRHNLRAGADPGLPVTRRDYAVVASPPNQGGQDQLYGADYVREQHLETARGLAYALDGSESDGTPAAPAGGHDHNEGPLLGLPWLAVSRVKPSAAVPDVDPGEYHLSNTTDTPLAAWFFTLPRAFTKVRVGARVSTGSAETVSLTFKFYSATDPNAIAASAGCVGGASVSGWVRGGPVDLSGIALTSGRRRVFVRVDGRVTVSTVQIFELLIYPQIAYHALPAKAALDEATALPNRALPASDLQKNWIDTPARIRDLIYGTSLPRRQDSRAHDHGEGGGERLERSLLSLCFGAHEPEGGGATANPTIGIPVDTAGTGVDFTVTPKLLVQALLFVPGGVGSVVVSLAARMAGTGTDSETFTIQIRPLADVGLGPTQSGVTGSIVLADAVGAPYAQGTATLDTGAISHVGEDRALELAIWLATNPPASSPYRLLGVEVYPGAAPAALPPPVDKHPAREEAQPAQVFRGQELQTSLSAKARSAWNQAIDEALGGVPGVDVADPAHKIPDRTDPWRREGTQSRGALGLHNHRGSYTDPRTGLRVDDGAVYRSAVVQHYAGNVNGGTPEAATADANPARGIKFHADDNLAIARFVPFITFDCPKGLGALDLYLLIEPGTDLVEVRLSASISVLPLTRLQPRTAGATIATRIADQNGGTSASSGSIWLVPYDGPLWQRSDSRLRQGLGVWTRDALLPAAEAPSGANRTNVARWARVKIEIDTSGFDDAVAPCEVIASLGLLEGGPAVPLTSPGPYANDARILCMAVVAGEGY